MKRPIIAALQTALMLGLAACGGGGSGGASTAVSTVTGVAATGAALANAPVTILDSGGASACEQNDLFTNGSGSYTCTLRAGEVAPFFIRVTDPTGASSPLYSVATQTPTSGSTLTVNATPLTTAIVAQLASGNAQTFFSNRTADATQLAAVTNNVVSQLSAVLASIGLSNYDPFNTPISAATSSSAGSTSDQLLDIVKVTTNSSTGQMELSLASSGTAVPVATANSPGSALPQPSASLSSLAVAAQAAAQSWTQCLTNASSQRQTLGAACLNFLSVQNGGTGAPDYLTNNQGFASIYASILGNSGLTLSSIPVPSILLMREADGAASSWLEQHDWAVLNFSFTDSTGTIVGMNDIFANIPNSGTVSHPSTWWMVGNQRVVNVNITPEIQRFTQMNSAHTTGGGSTFQTGLNLVIRSHKPNSSPSVNFKYAKITGDGLPTGGLWMQQDPANTAGTMSIINGYSGINPPASAQTSVCVSCPVYWFAYTSGTDAQGVLTYGSNWAGSDAAQGSDGSYNGSTGTRPIVGSVYTVSLYTATDTTTPSVTVRKFLNTPVVDPKAGRTIPWNTFGSQALAALDPSGNLATAQSSVTVDWIRNQAAQPVSDTYIPQSDGNVASSAFNNGTTSALVTAVSPATFAAFSSGAGSRRIGLHYLMVDGSSKYDVIQYDH